MPFTINITTLNDLPVSVVRMYALRHLIKTWEAEYKLLEKQVTDIPEAKRHIAPVKLFETLRVDLQKLHDDPASLLSAGDDGKVTVYADADVETSNG
jgi:hypothetical protein